MNKQIASNRNAKWEEMQHEQRVGISLQVTAATYQNHGRRNDTSAASRRDFYAPLRSTRHLRSSWTITIKSQDVWL